MENTPKHIVALSGGRDSVAMALRLAEVEPRDYIYVCTPTGDELPEMVAHWRKIEGLLGKEIVDANAGETLNTLIFKMGAIPNWRMRWCTRILKILSYQAFITKHLPVVSYVGLRADEEERTGLEWNTEGFTTRHPMKEWGWSIDDVVSYLKVKGIEIPRRTDCARCFFQTLHEWYLLWRDYPEIFWDAAMQEVRIEHTYRSKGRDTWPAALTELAKEFDSGRIPKERKRKGCND